MTTSTYWGLGRMHRRRSMLLPSAGGADDIVLSVTTASALVVFQLHSRGRNAADAKLKLQEMSLRCYMESFWDSKEAEGSISFFLLALSELQTFNRQNTFFLSRKRKEIICVIDTSWYLVEACLMGPPHPSPVTAIKRTHFSRRAPWEIGFLDNRQTQIQLCSSTNFVSFWIRHWVLINKTITDLLWIWKE